jgi:hypothetical protein
MPIFILKQYEKSLHHTGVGFRYPAKGEQNASPSVC